MERPITNHLEIQFQQDLNEDNTTSACVLCPLAEGLAPISACQSCRYCAGLEVDPALGKASILCRKAGEPAKPAAAAPEGRFSPNAFAAKTPVSAVMTTKVICVSADMEITALADLLLSKGLSGTPVIDRSERPIGMISKTDLVRTWYNGRAEKEGDALPPSAAWEIMNPIVTVLHRETSVAKAASLFVSEGLHRVPVVDDKGKVVGLLSSTDILRWLAVFSGEVPEM